MSQQDHWKKKRTAPGLLSERKSWLNTESAGRGASPQRVDGQGSASQRTRQDQDQQ